MSDASEQEEPQEPQSKAEGQGAGEPEPKGRTYTEDEVNAIVRQKKAALEKQYKANLESQLSEAQKLASMTAEQKVEHERDALRAELEELKREKAAADMAKEARGILRESGIAVSDGLLSSIVAASADQTKQNVEDFKRLYTEAVEAEVTKRLKSTPPPAEPNGSGGKSRGQLAAERAAGRFKSKQS